MQCGVIITGSPERRLPTRAVVNGIAFYWFCIVTFGCSHVHLQFAQIQHFLGFNESCQPALFGSTTHAIVATRSVAWWRLLQLTLVASVVPCVLPAGRAARPTTGAALLYRRIAQYEATPDRMPRRRVRPKPSPVTVPTVAAR